MGVVPTILERIDHLPSLESSVGWAVGAASLTEARVVMLPLTRSGKDFRPSGSAPDAVIKVAVTGYAERSLSREATVLAALEADTRLGTWRSLLPEVLAEGEIDGTRYLVERALTGHNAASLVGQPSLRKSVQAVAADAARTLHEQTSVPTVVGEDSVDRWLAPGNELLLNAAGHRMLVRRALDRLAAEVRSSLVGRRVTTSRIHGDFWPGNLLVSPDGTAITGILDWDFAGEGELPVLDLLHLVVYTRRLIEGQELGGIVQYLLTGGSWSDDELSLLRSAGTALEEDAAFTRAALLLYWLRHVAANILQSDRYASNRRWLKRNVEPVLRLFEPSLHTAALLAARTRSTPAGRG